MAKSSKLVSMDHRQQSPLTPELKDFIDRAIVPALVRQYLAEADAQIGLAKPPVRVAKSDRSTAVTLRGRRP